jgi:hypothetical protein
MWDQRILHNQPTDHLRWRTRSPPPRLGPEPMASSCCDSSPRSHIPSSRSARCRRRPPPKGCADHCLQLTTRDRRHPCDTAAVRLGREPPLLSEGHAEKNLHTTRALPGDALGGDSEREAVPRRGLGAASRSTPVCPTASGARCRCGLK